MEIAENFIDELLSQIDVGSLNCGPSLFNHYHPLPRFTRPKTDDEVEEAQENAEQKGTFLIYSHVLLLSRLILINWCSWEVDKLPWEVL